MRSLIACAVVGASALFVVPGAHANSTVGAWQTWNTLPYFPVHSHLLPNGQVMIWPGDEGISGDQSLLLDPSTQNLSAVPQAGYDLFCSGHAFMGDGRLLVAGGHIANNIGDARAAVFDSVTKRWTAAPPMNLGRWYPTVTPLANGDQLVVSGDIDLVTGSNPLPQVFQAATGTWRDLSSAQFQQALYPNMFLAPNGQVVAVGPDARTRSLNTTGTGKWTVLNTARASGFRDYGAAVMYAPGKILFVGGGSPPTNQAEVLDLNVATPTWRTVAPMATARRQLNATLLPDGRVLVTGGSSGEDFNEAQFPVFTNELWDPATETWTTMASALVPRLYHSSATLLPDGRVLTLGGNGQLVPEVFSPPYLFKGPRPVIGSAPTSVAYGQGFAVQTSQAASISKVTLVRTTSVTHSVNMNQRLNTLPFTLGSGTLQVTAPANGQLAPPGDYLLFIVDGQGVPSTGRMVRLSASAPPPPPPPTSWLLTVTKAGPENGNGTVTSVPSGIQCGTTCTASFADKTSVVLSVTVSGRATFAGWSGACSGTGTCTVQMTAAKSVKATFRRL